MVNEKEFLGAETGLSEHRKNSPDRSTNKSFGAIFQKFALIVDISSATREEKRSYPLSFYKIDVEESRVFSKSSRPFQFEYWLCEPTEEKIIDK